MNLLIIISVLIKNTFLQPKSQKYQFSSNSKAKCRLFDLNNVEPKPKYKLGQGVMRVRFMSPKSACNSEKRSKSYIKNSSGSLSSLS